MLKALLFDLDNTLLSSDVKTFMGHYFRILASKFAHLVPPDELVKQIMSSTKAVIDNLDPTKTNWDVFFESFSPKIGRSPEELWPIFKDFYVHDFEKLRIYTEVKPEARPIMEEAFARGFEVVIATNPLFPEIAVRQRLKWAEVGDFDYKLITTLENMHFCKPHVEYYEEILEKISCQAQECMMVGNDFEEDIVPASEVGIKTFWVTEKSRYAMDKAGFYGSLADFKRLLESGKLI